jgi:protein-tyrosine kinase
MWNPFSKPADKKIPPLPAFLEGSTTTTATTEPPHNEQTADKQRSGWVSPTYTQSRPVYLDPFAVAANRCVAALPNSREIEPYKVLRTHILQRTAGASGNTIMITSALPGEGKTTTAINLAFTFAREYSQTVLLVDCDLRQQAIHKTLGMKSRKGLLNYLVNDEPISDLIVWPGFEKLTLISGGRTIHESTELLGSPKMKELVRDVKNRYPDRYVFFDVPSLLTSADSLAFAPLVDHVLIVVAAGTTPSPDIKRALALIPEEKVLGLVLNRSAATEQGS